MRVFGRFASRVLDLGAPLIEELGRQVPSGRDVACIPAEAVSYVRCLPNDEPVVLVVDIDYEEIARIEVEATARGLASCHQ